MLLHTGRARYAELCKLIGNIAQHCLQDAWTPLHYAACNGHLPVTETLLQHGADADATEKVTNFPLQTFCNDDILMCMALLQ